MPIGRTRGSSIGFTVNQENRFTKGRIDVKRTVSCCVCKDRVGLPIAKKIRITDTYFTTPQSERVLLEEGIRCGVREHVGMLREEAAKSLEPKKAEANYGFVCHYCLGLKDRQPVESVQEKKVHPCESDNVSCTPDSMGFCTDCGAWSL